MVRSNLIYSTEWGQIAVASIPDIETLERDATAEELQSVASVTALSRRAERLAWRALLRRLSPGVEVEYLGSGKPQLKNSRNHISVSHCRDCVAVALSQIPCGVDIERLDRNFSKVAARYISATEAALSADEHWAAVVWCAKEALYKMAGREGVDFLRDMQITSASKDSEAWHLTANLFDEEVTLRGVMPDKGHILVFTV